LNSIVPHPSRRKLLQLFDVNDFETPAPQHPIDYFPAGNGDVLDIVVHQNLRLSHATASDILDSDHVPVVFHILDLITSNKLLEPLEKFTDWERFQSLASNLISPRIEINSGVEVDKWHENIPHQLLGLSVVDQ
jgi:hypothetical protein